MQRGRELPDSVPPCVSRGPDTRGPGPGTLLSALVAAGLFWVAYDNGSYSLASRSTLAIAVWWGFIVAIAFGLWPRTPVPRAAMLVGGLIAALALWIFASLLRTPNAEATFEEFNRASLYLGTFIVVALVSRRTNLGRFADGLAMAVTGVAAVALISRLFPGSFPEGDLPTFLPGTVTRLSFPLGYWNGLAIFLALGIPLLLRLALVARSGLVRGLALTPMPVITAAVYLTSSRGGVATALAGSLVLVVLTERRWAVAAALAASLRRGCGRDRRTACAGRARERPARDRAGRAPGPERRVAHRPRVSLHRRALRARRAPARGRAASGKIDRTDRRRRRPRPGAVGIVASIRLRASGGSRRCRAPTSRRATVASSKAHLLSGGGSGRWQFWSAALDQWEAHRILGAGAGTYESWWAQHASFSYFVRDAHSLYLEALGELGIVGFLLIVEWSSPASRSGYGGHGGRPAKRESRPRPHGRLRAYTVSLGSSGCGS